MKICDTEWLGQKGVKAVGSFQVLMPAAKAVPTSPFRDIAECPRAFCWFEVLIIIKALKVVALCQSFGVVWRQVTWPAARYTPAFPLLPLRGTWCSLAKAQSMGLSRKDRQGLSPEVP